MISEGYRTHGAVTGPMKFKKKDVFFGQSCSRDFGAPGCNPCSLIDLANTALASRGLVKPICIISKGYRTNRVVTGPMKFKKSGRFFSESFAPGIWGAGCHLDTLIDLANIDLASKVTVQPKCMISEGYRTHGGVTGPMNFKKRTFFFLKIVLPGFWGPCLPSKHLN